VKTVGAALKDQSTLFAQAKYQSKRGRAKTPVVDIVLFKECFMSTLETAFELDHARFMIASQGKVPRLNWPYKELFRCLAENEDPEKAAG